MIPSRYDTFSHLETLSLKINLRFDSRYRTQALIPAKMDQPTKTDVLFGPNYPDIFREFRSLRLTDCSERPEASSEPSEVTDATYANFWCTDEPSPEKAESACVVRTDSVYIVGNNEHLMKVIARHSNAGSCPVVRRSIRERNSFHGERNLVRDASSRRCSLCKDAHRPEFSHKLREKTGELEPSKGLQTSHRLKKRSDRKAFAISHK